MSILHLRSVVFKAIRTHGERTYPYECCGVLLGSRQVDQWHVEDFVEAGNIRIDSAHNRYQISPLELVKIDRSARQRGLEIAGFYHSHPDHPAQWSSTDFEEAHWMGCSYVITAVEKGKAAQTNSFALIGTSEEAKRFEPEIIQISD